MANQESKRADNPQVAKFKQAAAEVETDDSEDRFDKVLRQVVEPRRVVRGAKKPPAQFVEEKKVLDALDAAYERNKGRK